MHTVLHLHWRPPSGVDGEPVFLLWAETSEMPQPSRSRGVGAPAKHARPHPLIVDDGEILRAFARTFGRELISQGIETFQLHLPSSRTGPLPSPSLVHRWVIDRDLIGLAPWKIVGLRLPLASGLHLLSSLHTWNPPGHMHLGMDVEYWHKAFHLTAEILSQQHYVPTIEPVSAANDAHRAVWRPVFSAPDLASRVPAMVAAIPPICRSEIDAAGAEPHPLFLITQFLNNATDHFVRTWGIDAPHRLGYLHEPNGVAAWLKALLLPQSLIDIRNGQLYNLAAAIREWQRGLAPIGDAHFVIALRLQPPATNGIEKVQVPESGWRLEYLLQARDDADVLVSAEQTWQTSGDSLIFRNRRFEHPQEKLLAGLGQAAKIFTPIERSLQSPTPIGVDLRTSEVYEFLRQATPLLHQSGFSLLTPPWWESAGARLGLRLHLAPFLPEPPDVIADPDSADRPVTFRWELVLGDAALTRQTFADIVALRSPLVLRDGHWLRIDPEQIEAAERFWHRQSFEGRIDLQTAIRIILSFDQSTQIAGLPVERVHADGWLPDLLACLTDGTDAMHLAAQPALLQGTLRPYQRYGYAWMIALRRLGLGACLADDMGLGKSIQAIALLLHERQHKPAAPTLVVCPTSLLGNWWREFKRFAPDLRVFIHHGPDRPRNGDFAAAVQPYEVVLTSYALARRDADFLKQCNWNGLILDEAQKIKNPEALVSQAVKTLPAQFRLALTGTPVENRLTELWSIMHFLNDGYLGSLASFRKNYAVPIESYQEPATTARLQRVVRPLILRRLKSDPNVIQDLPERLEMKVYCTLSDEQIELYQRVVEQGLPRIADARGRARRLHVFNLITRLKQILNHPIQFIHDIGTKELPAEPLSGRSGKLDRLTEMLEEILDVGDKALIYTQFAETGNLLTTHIQQQLECKVFFLHGGVPVARRQQMITRFQEDPHAAPFFVATLQTGGLGVNLTAATHVFHFDRWWNPAVEDQASDRIYRIGQKRNVQIHKFITAGTLEEGIDTLIERKQGLAEAIIGADDGWLGNLTDAELTDLLTLRQDRT